MNSYGRKSLPIANEVRAWGGAEWRSVLLPVNGRIYALLTRLPNTRGRMGGNGNNPQDAMSMVCASSIMGLIREEIL